MSQIEVSEDIMLTFDPSEDKILGVFKNGVHIKLHEAVIIIPKSEFNRLWKIWLKTKQTLCEYRNHYCGVMGYFFPIDPIRLEDIILNEWPVNPDDPEDECYEIQVTYPMYYIKKFEDICDMEHG